MEPLASRSRPVTLEGIVGQEHVLGDGKPLRIAIERRELLSFILWGPPGCGKTTLARVYAQAIDAEFFELSAVDAGKDDIRRVIGSHTLMNGKPKVLFIDEIHRFNKAQQDFLLPFVERGDVTLIGATTENPSFEVISALLSRCRVFVLNALSDDAIGAVIDRVYATIRSDPHSRVSKNAKQWLVAYVQGDARRALGLLDETVRLYSMVTVDTLREAAQVQHVRYDKNGEAHYDTISAFIKSMRAGQRDAAIYYLARMTQGGEDPLFIARRMIIFASEDVGIAQPTALVVANAVFDAVRSIGYPEAAINLAHGVAYLASCAKDRSAHDAFRAAQDDVQKYGDLSIPLRIRNAPTALMKDLSYGKGYEMYDTDSYLPEKLKKRKYFPDR